MIPPVWAGGGWGWGLEGTLSGAGLGLAQQQADPGCRRSLGPVCTRPAAAPHVSEDPGSRVDAVHLAGKTG